MSLNVQCPSCQSTYTVKDSMAGSAVRCKCGAQFKVAGSTPISTGEIAVRCTQCGKTHQAKRSMAGQKARCPCGAVLAVPPIQPAAAQANISLFDELTTSDLGSEENDPYSRLAPETDAPRIDRSDDDADYETGGALTFAMAQVARGVKPQAILQQLIDRGYSQGEAESILASAMPGNVLRKQQARATGRKHLRNGAILFAMGIIITVGSAALFPGIIILSLGLLVGGLFYFLYGLLVALIGQE